MKKAAPALNCADAVRPGATFIQVSGFETRKLAFETLETWLQGLRDQEAMDNTGVLETRAAHRHLSFNEHSSTKLPAKPARIRRTGPNRPMWSANTMQHS
jgi:hypothetical protein